MADDASLRDTVVVDPAAATTTAPIADPITTTTEPVVTIDPAAEELGRILLNSGITKENVNDVLAAPQALAALRHAIQNDPQEFLKMIERSDPRTGEKFLDALTDVFVKRHASDDPPNKDGKDDPNKGLMSEVKAL